MICVIGDLIEDIYIYGSVNRISPESPIPVLDIDTWESRPGGCGNVIANLEAFGHEVLQYSSKNSIKYRYVADNQIVFRADKEFYVQNNQIDFELNSATYCILSDYNKGYLHYSQEIVNNCKSNGAFVIVDPKKDIVNYCNADIVKLNKKELYAYTPTPTDINLIRKTYNIGSIVVTLGGEGVYICSDEYEGYIAGSEHDVADVTGAGDVFIAAMTNYLAKGNTLYDSCLKANILAGISVSKMGTYTLTDEDISKCNIVFTNGCFDILHRGHIDYLTKSKQLGYKLIVGLNSDSSIKSLKGNDRPINNENDRKAVLESLGCVDEVIIFNEPTPYNLIKSIRPDIITKGGDYKHEDVIGNDISSVIIIPFVEGYSTTKLINSWK